MKGQSNNQAGIKTEHLMKTPESESQQFSASYQFSICEWKKCKFLEQINEY